MHLLLIRNRLEAYIFLLLILLCGCHSHFKKGNTGNGPPISIVGDTTTDTRVIVGKVNDLETVNRLEDAISYINGNIKRFNKKDKGVLLNERGNVYFLKDDFEDALTSYLSALDIDSNNSVYILNVAKAYESLESLTNASFFANKILTLPTASDSEKANARDMIDRWDQMHTGH